MPAARTVCRSPSGELAAARRLARALEGLVTRAGRSLQAADRGAPRTGLGRGAGQGTPSGPHSTVARSASPRGLERGGSWRRRLSSPAGLPGGSGTWSPGRGENGAIGLGVDHVPDLVGEIDRSLRRAPGADGEVSGCSRTRARLTGGSISLPKRRAEQFGAGPP